MARLVIKDASSAIRFLIRSFSCITQRDSTPRIIEAVGEDVGEGEGVEEATEAPEMCYQISLWCSQLSEEMSPKRVC